MGSNVELYEHYSIKHQIKATENILIKHLNWNPIVSLVRKRLMVHDLQHNLMGIPLTCHLSLLFSIHPLLLMTVTITSVLYLSITITALSTMHHSTPVNHSQSRKPHQQPTHSKHPHALLQSDFHRSHRQRCNANDNESATIVLVCTAHTHIHTQMSTCWWASHGHTHIASQSSCLVLIWDTGAFKEQRELANESVMSADEEDDPWSGVMENPNYAWHTSCA